MHHRILGAAIIAALLLTAAPVASAAKPVPPSVWVVESGLHYGHAFTAATTATRLTGNHYFQARCYPAASTVYRETYGDGWVWGENFSAAPDGPLPQQFELTDPIARNWTGGGADCTIALASVRWVGDHYVVAVLASAPFSVEP